MNKVTITNPPGKKNWIRIPDLTLEQKKKFLDQTIRNPTPDQTVKYICRLFSKGFWFWVFNLILDPEFTCRLNTDPEFQ